MERWAERLGTFLAAQLQLPDERREVLVYGATVALHTIVTAVALLTGAALLGILPYMVAVMAAGAVLRHVSGGAHLSGSWRCTAVSTLVLLLTAGLAAHGHRQFLSDWPPALRMGAAGPVALLSGYWVYRYAPVVPRSRSVSPAHRQRLRRLSLRTAALLLGVGAVGTGLGAWWALPVLLGCLMQAFTLTPAGQGLARWMDALAERKGGDGV